MNSLSDRYVAATLRRLPARQRPDIERELRTSIADAVDDRLEAGTAPAAAEVAVLTELGDPARLAAGYADRPLHLIGPDLFLDYVRLLKTLLAVVVPAVAAAVGLVRGAQEAPLATLLGDILGAAITAAVHIAVWTTVLFAVIERRPGLRHLRAAPWQPSALPEPPTRRKRWGELIAESLAFVVVTTYVLLSPALTDPPMLDPWLWDTGLVYAFLTLAAAALAFSFVRYYVRWNVGLAIAGSLVNVASAVTLIAMVSSDHVLNPRYVTDAGWSTDTVDLVAVGLIVLATTTLATSVTENFRHAR